MSTLVERDRRWAGVGDDPGYLSTGSNAPRGAGVSALLALVLVAVAFWAAADGASAPVPGQQATVSLASAIDTPTFETPEPVALHDRDCTAATYAPRQSDLGDDQPHTAGDETEKGFQVHEAPSAWCPVA